MTVRIPGVVLVCVALLLLYAAVRDLVNPTVAFLTVVLLALTRASSGIRVTMWGHPRSSSPVSVRLSIA